MQHDSTHIILTARPMVWRLGISHEDIYSMACRETAYEDNRRSENDNSWSVLTDDDRPLFNFYLSMAVSDLTGLLARRIDPKLNIMLPDGTRIENNGIEESEGGVTFYLVMDENHEEHLLKPLHNYCMDYLVKRVLEQWYKRPGLADGAKASIIRVLEFRRRPVRRPIRSFL